MTTNPLTKMAGPLPIWAWLGVVGGGLLIARYVNKSGADAAIDSEAGVLPAYPSGTSSGKSGAATPIDTTFPTGRVSVVGADGTSYEIESPVGSLSDLIPLITNQPGRVNADPAPIIPVPIAVTPQPTKGCFQYNVSTVSSGVASGSKEFYGSTDSEARNAAQTYFDGLPGDQRLGIHGPFTC